MRREYKSVQVLGTSVKYLLYGIFLSGFLEFCILVLGIAFYQQVLFTQVEPEPDELLFLTSYSLIGTLRLILFLITAIVYIVWFGRSYGNIEALGGKPKNHIAWAYVSWFIPILGFIFPYKIAKETYLSSDENIDPNTRWTMPNKETPSLVIWWWALWVGLSIVGNYNIRLSNSEIIEFQKFGTYLATFSFVDGLRLSCCRGRF